MKKKQFVDRVSLRLIVERLEGFSVTGLTSVNYITETSMNNTPYNSYNALRTTTLDCGFIFEYKLHRDIMKSVLDSFTFTINNPKDSDYYLRRFRVKINGKEVKLGSIADYGSGVFVVFFKEGVEVFSDFTFSCTC